MANQNKDYQYSLFTKLSDAPIIKKFLNSKANVDFFKQSNLGLAKGFIKQINKKRHDLLHLHGVWDLPLIQAYAFAKMKNNPIRLKYWCIAKNM